MHTRIRLATWCWLKAGAVDNPPERSAIMVSRALPVKTVSIYKLVEFKPLLLV